MAAAAALLVLLSSCTTDGSEDPYGCTVTLDGTEYFLDVGLVGVEDTPFASYNTVDGSTYMVSSSELEPLPARCIMLVIDGNASGVYGDPDARLELLIDDAFYGIVSDFTVTITEFDAVGGDIRGTFSGQLSSDSGTTIKSAGG